MGVNFRGDRSASICGTQRGPGWKGRERVRLLPVVPRDRDTKPSGVNVGTGESPQESCQVAMHGKQGKPGWQHSSRGMFINRVAKGDSVNWTLTDVQWDLSSRA